MAKIHFRKSFQSHSVYTNGSGRFCRAFVVYFHVMINIYTRIAFREFFVMLYFYRWLVDVYRTDFVLFFGSIRSNPYLWNIYIFSTEIQRLKLCVRRIYARESQNDKDKVNKQQHIYLKIHKMKWNGNKSVWRCTKPALRYREQRAEGTEIECKCKVNKNGRERDFLTYAMEKQTYKKM